jgi:spore protease
MFFCKNASTDLALEAHENLSQTEAKEIEDGVEVNKEQGENAIVTKVVIKNEKAAKKMEKGIGTYITIEAPSLRERNKTKQWEVSQIIAKELVNLFPTKNISLFLVVGLGNWNATPDALGPKTVENILVTRHLHEYAPDLKGGTRPVAAIAPGVLGITGVETGEIVKGIVEKISPDCVIAVDALAARDLARINCTIQIATTGINPGSGIGNKRMGLTEETLGVPVIAIGVPTVVHAGTIAYNTLKILVDYLTKQKLVDIINEIERHGEKLFTNIIPDFVGDLMVTPKEIDIIIQDISKVIAGGINAALHPDIDLADVSQYLN